jgi:hypothetical protein
MKLIASFFILGAVLCGCASNPPPSQRATTVIIPPNSGTTTVVIPHDSGTVDICRDGSRPPCY